jgi:hypothetical protein
MSQPRSVVQTRSPVSPWTAWLALGVQAGVAAIVGVLAAQALALNFWPDAAAFAPLDSYIRSALFTFVPALLATALLAYLARHYVDPVPRFLTISAVILGLSFIPDYVLPVANRTLVASTIAASLHVAAAAIIVPMLVMGYRRMSSH